MDSIGWDTNNSAELEGLWQGLHFAQLNGFFLLIIEGDSYILINMVNQILQGTPSYKVGSSWRLDERLEKIGQWLSTHRVVTLKHIRRDGNKVANFLANIGLYSGKTLHVGTLNYIATTPRLQEYNDLVQNEIENEEETHLDAGDYYGN